MIDSLFVDTGGWIALLYAGDNLHERARTRLSEAKAQNRSLITTSAVLTETLDGFAQHNLKHLATLLRKSIEASQVIEVVTAESDLFQRAWNWYEDRADKQWSLTDCISFIVMQDRSLTDAVAYDQHFIQAGFRALLREEVGNL